MVLAFRTTQLQRQAHLDCIVQNELLASVLRKRDAANLALVGPVHDRTFSALSSVTGYPVEEWSSKLLATKAVALRSSTSTRSPRDTEL